MRLNEEEWIKAKSTREFMETIHVKNIDFKKERDKEIQDKITQEGKEDGKHLKGSPNMAHALWKLLIL